jgi:cytochrome b561
VLLLIGVALAVFAPHAVAGALGGGTLLGLGLGYFGLRHTRFETTDKGPVYIPHTYIGLFVTSLLVIRLVMRYFTVSTQQGLDATAGRDPWAAYQHNPLTIAILGLVIGYYVFYNLGVLRRSRTPIPM